MEPRAERNRPPTDEFDLDREIVKAEVAEGLFGEPRTPVRRGRFELLRSRGRGAMGVVYEALDTERDERVALKLLTRLDALAIQRLKREFRSLSVMDHPNLIRLDALFHEGGQWFFSMELVDGEPFGSVVRGPGASASASLRAAFRQLVAAVMAIHAAGKLHRDLKPSNVLVTESGHVVVLDFGLVFDEQMGSEAVLTQSEIVGTPAYMAPELVAGESASRASDWYAIGVMLFEALTGRLPYDGHFMSMLQQKQQRDAPDPRVFAADAAPDLCEICTQLLRREPSERWDGEQLLRRMGTDPAPIAPVIELGRRSVPNVFVGRQQELAALQDALERVRAGASVSVLLHSKSGVGKSALLERFAELASDGRTLVLRGRCHEQESVPYKVFDGVMDALSHHLRRIRPEDATSLLPRHFSALLQLFPALSGVPGAVRAAASPLRTTDARELRNQAFAALKELLLRLTDRTPVVIAVDDLQWGDVDSARMLASVLSPPEAPPLLFVGAYRSDEAASSEFLRPVLAEESALGFRAQRLELAPLGTAAASEMLRELIGVDHSATIDALAAEAAGVPFFITELARHVGTVGEADLALGGELSLERLILNRVAGVPAGAQRLLRVLSVAASPVELGVASEAAGLARADRSQLLALRTVRLLRVRHTPTADLAETYHDRIRETITASMSEEERRATHQALADALQRHDIADPERLVLHYLGAGDRVRAGETAVQAGLGASQKLAFNRAVQLFRSAISLLPLPGYTSHTLHRYLGDALANAGQGLAAGEAFLRAASEAPAEERLLLRGLAAVQYLGTPRVEEGRRIAREVFAQVGVNLPENAFAAAREFSAQRMLWTARRLHLAPRKTDPHRKRRLDMIREVAPALSWVDGLAGMTLQAQYIREALDEGDSDHILNAITSEAVSLAMIGGARNERKASREVARVREIAERTKAPYAEALVEVIEANRLLWTGRHYTDALAHAARARELLIGSPALLAWERTSIDVIESLGFAFSGQLRKLRAMSAEQERDSNERDDQFVPLMLTSNSAQSLLVEDRADEALALLTRMRPLLSLSRNFHYTWLCRIQEVLSYCGRSREAFELSEADSDQLLGSYLKYSEYVRYNLIYYRARSGLAAYLETADPRAAAVCRKALAALPDDSTSHGGYRAALAGSLCEAQGNVHEGIRLMQLAHDRFRACQAFGEARHAQHCLQRFRRDDAGLARVDEELAAEGVLNTERWVYTYIPYRLK